jgi:hypothetical protein
MKFLLLFLLALYTSTSPAKSTPQHDLLHKLLLTRVTDLQVLSVNNDSNLRYATWRENADIHLAVINQAKVSAKITVHDAYQPNLRKEVNWQYDKRPVLVFTYRQGAAAEFAELYGLDAKNNLVLLDQLLGEQIEWRISNNGEVLLSVYTKPNATLSPTCYRFNDKPHKLSQTHCD